MTIESPSYFPRTYLRFIALFWDSTILSFWVFLVIYISTLIGFESSMSHGLFIVLMIVSFEPLLIYFTGGTLGHRRHGMRVCHKTPGKSLSLIQCYARLLFKSVLGIYSLMAMLVSTNRRALHDMLSNSVVVFIDESKAPLHHKFDPSESERFIQPSIFRRLLIIVGYSTLGFVVQVGLFSVGVSEMCLNYRQCDMSEALIMLVVTTLGWPFQILVLMLGVSGRLYGAKRREVVPDDKAAEQ
ncbi:MAG: RDD family protein [Psychrosphaera sp.]|nr:RDD family protein [Psychrosphaera sp.]